MSLTVRLNPRTERSLNALARRRRQTRSDVVREALEHYTATHAKDASALRPYDAWADVIGIVHSGGRDPLQTTGERFTEIVREKALRLAGAGSHSTRFARSGQAGQAGQARARRPR